MTSRVFAYAARVARSVRRGGPGVLLLVGMLLAGGNPTAAQQARPPVMPSARLAMPGTGQVSTSRFDMAAELGGVTGEQESSLLPTTGDENWQQLFGPNQASTDGDIFAVAVIGSDIYVAGSFTAIGGVKANHVARWDGKAWTALGSGDNNGVDANAYAMVVSGDTLYVGGEFTNAGGVPASRVARYLKSNGSWSALGAGITGPSTVYVGALALSRGILYVGGNFTRAGDQNARSIAQWDARASRWSPLGSGTDGVDGEVYSMATTNTDLYIGGNFSRAGTISAGSVARWDIGASTWNALGTGVRGYVNALAFYKGAITAGGEFSADGYPDVNLATFNTSTSTWGGFTAALGQAGMYSDAPAAGKTAGVVRALAASGSVLYVGGVFRSAFPATMSPAAVAANNVVLWNGASGNTAFEPMASNGGNGVSGPVNALVSVNNTLYAAGAFRTAGRIGANRLALWDGRKWSAIGQERFETGNVYAVLVNGNDIYIGRPANAYGQGSIAKWNGRGWTTIGLTAGSVFALAISGDELFVGGRFSSVEGTNAVNIARFNLTNKTWSSFGDGSGVGGGTYSGVYSLKVRGDEIYVGGRFTIADTIAAVNVAVYNRANGTWRNLGDGPSSTSFNIVYALEFGPGGELYAGGRFTTAGGADANNVARYANGTWSSLGQGVDGAVYALAFTEGQLFVGGDFVSAGGARALRAASYNPTTSQWSELGGGLSGGPYPIVYSMAANGGNVYFAGLFRTAGADSVNRIIRWSTASNSWKTLGSGVDNTVRAVTLANGMLHVVGEFGMAGLNASPNYAQWSTAKDTKAKKGKDEGRIELAQNYPNPFNPTTLIHFNLGQPGHTTLRVFDVSGNEVRRLVDEEMSAGDHAVVFDGTDLGSGMYFYQLRSGSMIETRKLLLSK